MDRDKALTMGLERAKANKAIVVLYQNHGEWYIAPYDLVLLDVDIDWLHIRYILPQGQVTKLS